MKKIILLLVLFGLCGCGKKEPVTHVCQGSSGKVMIVSVDDHVEKMTKTDHYTFDALNVTASFMEKEENKAQLLKNYKALYAGVTKGIEISMNVDEKGVDFLVTFDFTQADYQELASIGIVADPNVDFISLEKTIAQMNLICE